MTFRLPRSQEPSRQLRLLSARTALPTGFPSADQQAIRQMADQPNTREARVDIAIGLGRCRMVKQEPDDVLLCGETRATLICRRDFASTTLLFRPGRIELLPIWKLA